MTETLDDAMREELEGFDVGEVVELFTLDARAIGGDVYFFTPAPKDGEEGPALLSFGGQRYSTIPLNSEGWEWSSNGPLPSPRITFGLAREDGDQTTVAAAVVALINQLDDLLGAKLYRLRTLGRHLDGGEDPNADAHMGVEVYIVSRKAEERPDGVSFELKSGLDHEGVMLPRRQVLRRCAWRYRVADGEGGFDYAEADCPYTGSAMFSLAGEPVASPALDRCGKRLVDCRSRFGENAQLPFGGFPGVGRLGVS